MTKRLTAKLVLGKGEELNFDILVLIDSLILEQSNDSTDSQSCDLRGRIKGTGVDNGGESSGHIPT